MARTAMTLSNGAKIAEHLSIGLLARGIPLERVEQILRRHGRESRRVRDLPAAVVVYYVIALGLLMAVSTREVLRCLLEGLQWLGGDAGVRIAGKSAISQARSRLGAQPLQDLWKESAKPLAHASSPGAFFGRWRVVILDGSTLDVSDTATNLRHFGRQRASRGSAAYPQLRFVGLAEAATHALFAVQMGPYHRSELELAQGVLSALTEGMLCLADRLYSVFPLWQSAQGRGAQLVWRVRQNAVLPVEKPLQDGSYLSSFYPSTKARRHGRGGIVVRVVEYQLDQGAQPTQTLYRLLSTILDPQVASAQQLAELYHRRWEIEGLFDELKTHLRGGRIVLRSKQPQLVEQEFYGLLLAHWTVRCLMYEAAQGEKLPPDKLSFTHALRIVRRKLAAWPAIPPSTP